jgi:hypothetical protein
MSASSDSSAAGAKPLGSIPYRVGRLLGRIEVTAERIPPWAVLGVILLVGWGVAVAAGRIAGHDGWLYYHGGDGTWYYTTAWALGNGHIPAAVIGFGYPLLTAPIAGIAGSNLLDGIPAIVVFNQLVLAPIALICIYGITRTFASRSYAYVVSLLWVLTPVLVIHYFLADYHSRYVDLTLPSAIGLTGLGDYPSMVVLLVSAYFLLRAVATLATLDAVAAGLAAGFALAVKPANALFLPAVLVALAIARRPRTLGIFALSLIPSLVALTLWKYRGLGYLPAFSHPPGTAPATVVPVSLGLNVHQYVSFDWSQLHHNLDSIREYTWSQRMVYWAALAGVVGLARRSYVAAALAATWLTSYLLVKGSSKRLDFVTGSFMTHLIAAFPAYFLLAVSVPFLVPIYGRRRPPARVGPHSSLRVPKIAVSVLGFLAVVGFLVIALLPTLDEPAAAKSVNANLYLPVDAFVVASRESHGVVTLSWARQQPAGTRASDTVFRNPSDRAICVPVRHAAADCAYTGTRIAGIRRDVTSWTDHPPPGTWVYRVALNATPVGVQSTADYILLSRPVTVTARP